ncbi:MAG: hypothetical protein KGZ74_12410 [Chitinophagaceae bacterium]|nr:hypothetical protein [Chitinophagaceae bacterium]
MVLLLILIVSNFAVVMTLGNTNLLPVCIMADYVLIKHWQEVKQQKTVELLSFVPHLLLGLLLTELPFSRDHDYYYNLVSKFHLQGVETHSPFTSVSFYHHFDLWCMAVAMKISSWLGINTAHYNFYSFVQLLLVAMLSFRVKKVLFSRNLPGFGLFVMILLLVNSYLSKFTWFIDFELNGAKQTLLLLLVFEMAVCKNKNLQQLYFITFIASNPLINSWFSSAALFAFVSTYILYRNKEEFRFNLNYFKSMIFLMAFFWILYIVRSVIDRSNVPGATGITPYQLLLPSCIKCIATDVLTFFKYNLHELYLRLMVLFAVVGHLLLFVKWRRLSMAIIIYLLMDLVQTGYFGYKFFEFQQFTSIPLSIIVLFVLGNTLYNSIEGNWHRIFLQSFRKQNKVSGLS